MPKISLKERKKLDLFHEQRKAQLRKKYPEIHGKKLDYVTHSFEDNDGGADAWSGVRGWRVAFGAIAKHVEHNFEGFFEAPQVVDRPLDALHQP